MEQNQTVVPGAESKKSLGPILGIVIIIIILVVGAFYVWGGKTVVAPEVNRVMAPESTPVSKSDDIDSIDQDLKADAGTNVDFSSINDVQ